MRERRTNRNNEAERRLQAAFFVFRVPAGRRPPAAHFSQQLEKWAKEPEETNEVQITPEPDQEPDTFATTEPTTEYDQIATATPDTADDQLEFSPAAGNDSSGQTAEEPEETDKEEGYILPDSSVKKLTKKDVKGLSKDQCRYARNEIYARHGRKFTDKKLQDYFDNQSWYEGTVEPEDFDESVLSKVEKKNIKLLKKYENK